MRYLLLFLLCCTLSLNAQKNDAAIAENFIVNIVGDEIFQKHFVYSKMIRYKKDSIEKMSYDLIEDGETIENISIHIVKGKDIKYRESKTLLLEWYKRYFENDDNSYVRYKDIRKKAIYHIGEEDLVIQLKYTKELFDKYERKGFSLALVEEYVWECENYKMGDFFDGFYTTSSNNYTHSLYINPYDVNLYAIKTDGYSSMQPTPLGELESLSKHVPEWEDSIINHTDTTCTHLFIFTNEFRMSEVYKNYLGIYSYTYGLLKELPKQDTIIIDQYSTVDYKIKKKEVLIGIDIVSDYRDIEIKLYYNDKSQVVALIHETKEVPE